MIPFWASFSTMAFFMFLIHRNGQAWADYRKDRRIMWIGVGVFVCIAFALFVELL